MIKKSNILLIIFVLGAFLAPSMAYACGTSQKTEKSCCKKESKATNTKQCCKKNTADNQKEDDCGGKCNMPSCKCPTPNVAFVLPSTSEIKINAVQFVCKIQNFYNVEIYLSSGFLSIWTPPNIA